MPRVEASVELLASPQAVWRFLSEPYHLTDWWPNLVAVEPDRLGLATGARWRIRSRSSTMFRKAESEDTLLILAVDPETRVVFEFVRRKVRAELGLTQARDDRTRADLQVTGVLLVGFSRNIAKDALARLHSLVQTAATV